MAQWRWIGVLALLGGLAACSGRAPPRDPGAFTPISGKARVLSIDHALGVGTLSFQGRRVNFWWKNKETHPSASVSPNPETPAPWWNTSGADQNMPLETSDTDRPFNAQPGDTIYFRGFELRGEILLTVATAVKS